MIKEETESEDVLCWPLELTSFASVKCFVARFEHHRDGCLDIMVLNAAMATLEYGLTTDGFESTYAPFLFDPIPRSLTSVFSDLVYRSTTSQAHYSHFSFYVPFSKPRTSTKPHHAW